jgi:hypothetical protein
VVAEGDAVAEEDVARPTDSPITAHISAAAAIHPPILFDSNRHTRGQRSRWAVVTEAELSGDEAGAEDAGPAPPDPPAIDGPDGAPDMGPASRFSSGFIGSYSFTWLSSYADVYARVGATPMRTL